MTPIPKLSLHFRPYFLAEEVVLKYRAVCIVTFQVHSCATYSKSQAECVILTPWSWGRTLWVKFPVPLAAPAPPPNHCPRHPCSVTMETREQNVILKCFSQAKKTERLPRYIYRYLSTYWQYYILYSRHTGVYILSINNFILLKIAFEINNYIFVNISGKKRNCNWHAQYHDLQGHT